jgi:hypothetical protein
MTTSHEGRLDCYIEVYLLALDLDPKSCNNQDRDRHGRGRDDRDDSEDSDSTGEYRKTDEQKAVWKESKDNFRQVGGVRKVNPLGRWS